MQKTTVYTIDTAECQNNFDKETYFEMNASTIICTNNNVTHKCQGNHGVPLGHIVDYKGLRFVQYGITMSACSKTISVYTNVVNVIDWIIANMHE